MNLRRILIVAIALTLVPLTFFAYGGDFGRAQSLFTDIKAHKIGDNITVLIFENTNAIDRSQTKNEESGNTSVSGGPMTGALDFLPLFGASTSNSSDYDGKGEVRKTQTLRAKMTVTVVGLKENGDMIIEGRRSVGIGPNTETLYLTGVVRPKDVTTDNTVDSYLIADAKIIYDGDGPSQNSTRPGIVARLMGWLF
ncbi:MAG: flagellar basal body L-ring protein FlgH [candidate division Zixibacteria bacterium]|nr:flagellar basal body L-ring protein FlgH [candidate division Zixibacteria bacterium]